MALKNRTDLKSYFVKNAIPTESNFADLIDSQINQTEDGVLKPVGEPLTVIAAPADQKRVLRMYSTYPAANPDWMISLNPAQDPANIAATMKPGFGITDGTGRTRLFVDKATGQIGVGTNAPQAALDVVGPVRASGGLTIQSMLDVSASTTTTNGWLEAIRFSRPEHGAITHPGGHLLFGLHSNRSFYWVDTASGKNVMQLAADTGTLTVTGQLSLPNGSHVDTSGNLTLVGALTQHGYGMLTDPTESFNCHLPFSNNCSYISGNQIILRSGKANGYAAILTATAADSSVSVAGPLTVGGFITATNGARLGAIGIGGGNIFGAVSYPYETMQLNPGNNFRMWFGTRERVVVENNGQMTIYFDQGYWRFQTDGNLVKYNYANQPLWALNDMCINGLPGPGRAGW